MVLTPKRTLSATNSIRRGSRGHASANTGPRLVRVVHYVSQLTRILWVREPVFAYVCVYDDLTPLDPRQT